MKNNLLAAFFLVAVAFAAPNFAQTTAPTEKQAAIKELVVLISTDNKAEDLISVIMAQMENAEDATIKTLLDERPDLTTAERKEIEAVLLTDQRDASRKFQDKLMQKLSVNDLMLEIAAVVYDKHYTLEEIRDLITFYKTPTGQKSIRMATPIMSDTLQLVNDRLLTKLPTIIKELETENRRELEQKINARKPKPKTKATE